jgi:hypothetical protein
VVPALAGVFVLLHYCKYLTQTDHQYGERRLAWNIVVCCKVYQAGVLSVLAIAHTLLLDFKILCFSFLKK